MPREGTSLALGATEPGTQAVWVWPRSLCSAVSGAAPALRAEPENTHGQDPIREAGAAQGSAGRSRERGAGRGGPQLNKSYCSPRCGDRQNSPLCSQLFVSPLSVP